LTLESNYFNFLFGVIVLSGESNKNLYCSDILMELDMGIHHDYKSKRGERAMAKQQKREAKFADNSDKKEEEKIVKELKKAGLNATEIKQFLEGRSK
jgi:hypothetical protein